MPKNAGTQEPATLSPSPGRKQETPAASPPPYRVWILVVVLFAAGFLITYLVTSLAQPATATISYNSFLDQIAAGNVTAVSTGGDVITGTARVPVTGSSGVSSRTFRTERPAFATDDLEALLIKDKVAINASDLNASTPLWELLLFSGALTAALVLGVLYLSSRAAAGGGSVFNVFGPMRRSGAEARPAALAGVRLDDM